MANHPLHAADLLTQRVDEVLHYIWDPIGVSGVPEARDEYNTYVPMVVGLMANGISISVLAAHLNAIVVERMGLPENTDHSTQVASVLLDWYENLRSSHA